MSTLKFLTLISTFIFFGFYSNAQIVEIESGTQGIVFPRVTSTTDVSAPAEGMVVYQTGVPEGLYQYDGSSWSIIGGGGSSAPQLFTAFCGLFSSSFRYGMFGQTNRIIEGESQFYMTQAGTISNFCVFLEDGIDAGANTIVTLRKNGVNQVLTHTFDPSDGDHVSKCSSAGSVSYAVGDLISVRFEETTGTDPGSPYFMCSMDFTPN